MLITHYYSVAQAAKRLGCTTGRVRQLLRDELLKGEKLNARAWAVDRRSVERAAKREQVRGRPRIGTPA